MPPAPALELFPPGPILVLDVRPHVANIRFGGLDLKPGPNSGGGPWIRLAGNATSKFHGMWQGLPDNEVRLVLGADNGIVPPRGLDGSNVVGFGGHVRVFLKQASTHMLDQDHPGFRPNDPASPGADQDRLVRR